MVTLVLIALLASGTQAAFTTNGGFESGDFTGWTAENLPGPGGGAPLGSWFVYSGTTSPLSGFPIEAPPEGNFAATKDQTGPGTHIVYQDVTLEAGETHSLSLFVYYENEAVDFFTPDTLDYDARIPDIPTGQLIKNQQFRIDIMDPTADVYSVATGDVKAMLFRTESGGPLTLPPTFMAFDISQFAGETVRVRMAVADNQFFLSAAVDDVRVSTDTAVNDPPQVDAVPPVSVFLDDTTDISLDFLVFDVETPDAEITWAGLSSDAGTATVGINPTTRVATITGIAPGQAGITLTATDGGDPNGCSGTPPGCHAPLSGQTTVQVTVLDQPAGAVIQVDFMEITYFENKTVITSSDLQILADNGIMGPFNPNLWPYDPNGGKNKTKSRGTLFRIYGFSAASEGNEVRDAIDPQVTYEVVEDVDIPGAFYIDLEKATAVLIDIDDLQTNVIKGKVHNHNLPGSVKLSNDQLNVSGIMLTRNRDKIQIPARVRDELEALGMPLLNQNGNKVQRAFVDYVGFQLWGKGKGKFREFVDVEIRLVNDSVDHYEFGFHTAKNAGIEGFSGCNYKDFKPGNDTTRFNDVWKGNKAGHPDFGPACGSAEPSDSQSVRENYDVPIDGIQLLPTVAGAKDTARIFWGPIRVED